MPAKKKPTDKPLAGADLIKEVNRRIRAAKSLWDAHNNAACRGERDKAIALYETLTHEQREKVPEQLRVWLRYRPTTSSAPKEAAAAAPAQPTTSSAPKEAAAAAPAQSTTSSAPKEAAAAAPAQPSPT